VRVAITHYPLHPETPEQGMTLAELFAGRNLDIPAMHARMSKLMADEGLPYATRTHTYNSRLAQELAKWAEPQPGGEAIHNALFRAYFMDLRNIGQVDELARIAESIGLSGAEAREALAARRFKDAVDADWRRSREAGVTGVPTFVAGGYGVVGAQPYDVLQQLVRQVRAET
jgi:predicted DsbA family dithiol-disulfide isomerase